MQIWSGQVPCITSSARLRDTPSFASPGVESMAVWLRCKQRSIVLPCLLIAPSRCRPQSSEPYLFDGCFDPAHPSVVALLADARKTHFLVFGDFRRRVSQLEVERLASDNALWNPTRKQILLRVSRVATEDAGLHGAKFSADELRAPIRVQNSGGDRNPRPTGSKTWRYTREFREGESVRLTALTGFLERAMGIEPTSAAWEAVLSRMH